MKPIAIIAGVAALIGLSIYWEVSLWNECRQTNSWLYCIRVLGK